MREKDGERRQEPDLTLRFGLLCISLVSLLSLVFIVFLLYLVFLVFFVFVVYFLYLDLPVTFQVFILRIFMWLIVGVISGAWAWSSKSLSSWKLLANRFDKFVKIIETSSHSVVGASVSGLGPRSPQPLSFLRWPTRYFFSNLPGFF